MKLGTKFRYAAALIGLSSLFVLLSMAFAFPWILGEADRSRERLALVSARLTAAGPPSDLLGWFKSTKDAFGPDLPNVKLWVLDGQGSVIAETPGGVLPIPWSEMPRARDVFRFERFPSPAVREFTGIFRLDDAGTRFLVVSYDRFGPVLTALVSVGLLFDLWVILGCSLISLALIVQYFRSRAGEAVEVLGRLQAGELGARFRTTRMDEIGRLMLLFNRMADEIEHLVGRLRQAETSRTRLMQEISHDTRTPLTAVRAALETAQENYDRLDEADRKRCVAIAHHEVLYLQQLIEDLFFLAEMDEPQYRRETEEVSLTELVRSEIEKRRSRAEGGPRPLRWEMDTETALELKVLGNSRLLLRLIRNAFDNAEKHARERVRVTLSQPDERHVRVAVLDDGPGASSAGMAAFGYRRGRGPAAGSLASGASLGLGSVIMKEVAALHHGDVRLANGPAGGARLEIELPVVLLRNVA